MYNFTSLTSSRKASTQSDASAAPAANAEAHAGAATKLQAAHATTAGTAYPLATVLVVALIAFLCGSLLRSLLSPADFVYLATDARDAEDRSVAGWREIRRLLEVKYIAGGWDFQIAVVRRH
jgi:hypothetical protein